MATAVRIYQASDVSVADTTKASDYNKLRDDIEMSFTEFDYGDTADTPGTPTLGQVFMNKELDVLLACFDAGSWVQISPHSSIFSMGQTLSSGTANYAGFGISHVGTTRLTVETPAPYALAIDQLYVTLESAPTGTEDIVVTLHVNGVDQELTCTISDTDTIGNDTDLSHGEAVGAGALICWKVAPTSDVASGINVKIGCRVSTYT